MNEIISLRRLGLLVRNDVVASYRTLLVTSATLAVLMLLTGIASVAFSSVTTGNAPELYVRLFAQILFLWGTIAASFAFKELHDKTRSEAYLLLPASALEKMVARVLFVTAGLIIYILFFTTVMSFLIEGLNILVFSRRNAFFNPFDSMLWGLIAHFVVVQSLFFLGGAWFRKHRLVKTVLLLSIIGISLTVFSQIITAILFADSPAGIHVTSASVIGLPGIVLANPNLIDGIWFGAGVLYFGILAPFCWFVTWLRIRETQVSDGI